MVAGTRIIYDRKFLLECRNSPIARTPPCCLPHIPGVTMQSTHPLDKLSEQDEDSQDVPGETLKGLSHWAQLNDVNVRCSWMETIDPYAAVHGGRD